MSRTPLRTLGSMPTSVASTTRAARSTCSTLRRRPSETSCRAASWQVMAGVGGASVGTPCLSASPIEAAGTDSSSTNSRRPGMSLLLAYSSRCSRTAALPLLTRGVGTSSTTATSTAAEEAEEAGAVVSPMPSSSIGASALTSSTSNSSSSSSRIGASSGCVCFCSSTGSLCARSVFCDTSLKNRSTSRTSASSRVSAAACRYWFAGNRRIAAAASCGSNLPLRCCLSIISDSCARSPSSSAAASS
mmetsp:Transcript_17859/g.39586  ORF Transcript_17859/g.39586 Transcript_17859/m.39586 type:complete len:246 (-) Transcript_17859:2795-3532(-)